MNGRTRAAPRVGRSAPGRAENSSGSASVELVLVVPVLVALIVTVVGGGRLVDARGQVNDAAYAAARSASLTPTAPLRAGAEAARNSLIERGEACHRLSVDFAGTDFRPGGLVRATVHCTADLRDVVGFGLPGSRTFTASAVVPIERYRAP